MLSVVDVPFAFVALTEAEPAAPAGDTAVSCVDEMTVTDVADAVPNFTVVDEVKLVPVTVTVVPPAVVPLLGLSPVTDGEA